jgi:hypothetical protein
MDETLKLIFTQTISYATVLILAIGFFSVLLKGFFWKYLKVRTSFGNKVLVKIRSKLRDYYAIGWVEDGFLCHKLKKDKTKTTIRRKLPDNEKVFYRCLGVFWVDVDEDTNAICNVDYGSITGYDAENFNDLLERAIMKPNINNGFEKIVIAALVIIIILAAASAYLSYMGYSNTNIIKAGLETLKTAVQATQQTITSNAGTI